MTADKIYHSQRDPITSLKSNSLVTEWIYLCLVQIMKYTGTINTHTHIYVYIKKEKTPLSARKLKTHSYIQYTHKTERSRWECEIWLILKHTVNLSYK